MPWSDAAVGAGGNEVTLCHWSHERKKTYPQHGAGILTYIWAIHFLHIQIAYKTYMDDLGRTLGELGNPHHMILMLRAGGLPPTKCKNWPERHLPKIKIKHTENQLNKTLSWHAGVLVVNLDWAF